ncbi:hypothetical protein Taro_032849 [Colocasia esculenta]|uniref:Beta-fructofuranosidase n=1 Tax=Colocasia esculenta TaxID=4460 RepID=A0A843VYH5_COLES|nr:hypothetical protein [Colocasia esculenta]
MGALLRTPSLRRWGSLLLCLLLLRLLESRPPAEASHTTYSEYQASAAERVGGVQYRTGYHFQPPKNWINGPMYHNGVYHLFYQYNPKGAVWGNIVWAHSVSRDLVNWTPLPPAIYPSKPFDINGCWSGSATILPGNKPAILYTGIDPKNRQVQNVAFPKNLSDPFLREWVKPDYNPVINPGAGLNASAFRDPTTAWLGEDGWWRVTVGSKRYRRGMAVLYKSKDFVKWVKAKHPLHSAAGTGMWECPDFFPVSLRGKNGLDTSEAGAGMKHVLKVSLDLTRYEYYTVGRYHYKVDRYVPDGTSPDDGTGLRYDYGNFYASKTFFDPAKGRRILWGWSNESDSVTGQKGWAGIQTIPRALWLDGSGKQLVQWPVKEVEKLRGKRVEAHGVALGKGDHFEIKGITASQADVEVTFEVSGLEKAEALERASRWVKDPRALCERLAADADAAGGGVGPFGLWVLASGDLRERTTVFFRVFRAPHSDRHLVLISTTQAGVWKPSFAGFVDVDIQKEGKISLRTLIDRSVVESFGEGGKTCITSRVYPVHAVDGAAHLYAFNSGAAPVRISRLRAWQMGTPNMN